MSEARQEPDYETRAVAMKHAVHLIAESNRGTQGQFQSPGESAVVIAELIADYLANGPKEKTN